MSPAAFEPYENVRFAVRFDGTDVVGVSKVSGLIRTTDVVEHREGNQPPASHKMPGLTHFPPITLERGLSPDTAFESWANEVFQEGAVVGQTRFRKGVVIDLFNETGVRVASYRVYNCWPSEYQAFGALDADTDGIAIERLRLENEGWDRDTNVEPPPP